MDLKACDKPCGLTISHVEALRLLREPLSRAIEVLSRFLSPEAIIGTEEVVWPGYAPIPLRMVVFDPRWQTVRPGPGGNICLYHWKNVDDPPEQIKSKHKLGPLTLGEVITVFKDWLEDKFGSKIPYEPRPNPMEAHRVFAGLHEMAIEYWRRFPFNGITPDTIGVYSTAWKEEKCDDSHTQTDQGKKGEARGSGQETHTPQSSQSGRRNSTASRKRTAESRDGEPD